MIETILVILSIFALGGIIVCLVLKNKRYKQYDFTTLETINRVSDVPHKTVKEVLELPTQKEIDYFLINNAKYTIYTYMKGNYAYTAKDIKLDNYLVENNNFLNYRNIPVILDLLVFDGLLEKKDTYLGTYYYYKGETNNG